MRARHPELGERFLYAEGEVPLLFTGNETNTERLWGQPNATPWVKDAFGRYLIAGERTAINPDRVGTKAAVYYWLSVPARGEVSMHLRLTTEGPKALPSPFADVDSIFATRLAEADEFYASLTPRNLGEDGARVIRQALAGMLWSKQFYNYDLDIWLDEHGSNPMRGGGSSLAQQRLVPHGERPRHLDARQVGVPVVRGLGPRLPLHRAGHGRRRLRQAAARPHVEGELPAPQRADPGLRVELRRRQSTGARVGDLVRLQQREARYR